MSARFRFMSTVLGNDGRKIVLASERMTRLSSLSKTWKEQPPPTGIAPNIGNSFRNRGRLGTRVQAHPHTQSESGDFDAGALMPLPLWTI